MTSPHHRTPDRPGGPDDPGRGRRLGVDVGSVRIGVSCCDPDGLLATPVETVRRHGSGSHLRRLADLADEYDVVEVVVGLPRTLADRAGSAAEDAISVADELARVLRARKRHAPVRLADERLSTVSAARDLHAAGMRSKRQRSVIDQAAAVTILQSWLDQRRAVAPAARTEDDDV
ncbi:Holliday junction resolvase RuvX [[Mycobacterium] kokjensenii]|uniref:Putative pre-16S rRNA nuclease n=1 Tax=[Mycobacterium] kokjensenii TaxID=3064287 RepID=A0ABM9LI72_9MYCO|nr:Holliday junction resolvase RuvX [Mycolicibacter sp. MU0083]CAJ1499468.1 Holliday junction resolvase RuvX [Mycolicibacter sp. MU0083]